MGLKKKLFLSGMSILRIISLFLFEEMLIFFIIPDLKYMCF